MPHTPRTIRSLLLTVSLTMSLAAIGCGDLSRIGQVSTNRMSPEEEAVAELLKPNVNFTVTRQAEAATALSQYRRYTAEGNKPAADDASRRYFAAFNRLGNFLTGMRDLGGPPLLIPDAMGPLNNALFGFESLRTTVRMPLTDDDRHRIAVAIDRLAEADRALAAVWNARPVDYSAQPFSSTVTLGLAGIPLQLDVTTGQVKLKHTLYFGPVTATYTGGPGSSSGIRTLVIRNRHYRRHFAVGGKPIEVLVPRSRITTAGQTMTIEAIE
jgi:hypothetical protein